MRDMMKTLRERCEALGVRPPARATIYEAMARTPTKLHRIDELPASVREALYNLDGTSQVPGHQLAFYCFNYGDLAAVSFAAGLPWLALYQAARLPGWRARSRGLLDAVLRARKIQ